MGGGGGGNEIFLINKPRQTDKFSCSSFKISFSRSAAYRHARINSWQPRVVPGLAFI